MSSVSTDLGLGQTLRHIRAELASLRRSLKWSFSRSQTCCGTCCYASECLKLSRKESRFDTNAIAGGTNHLICMCGCSKRGNLPTIVRPWQPACPAYMNWKTYYSREDNDNSWMPPALKELPAGGNTN